MRPTRCSAAVLGGLLALLLLPGVVAAHEITSVRVDCAEQSILVSGESFGGPDGVAVTVTVSGPDGYLETFVAEPRVPWTVSLPLGPSGTYTIRWPDPEGGEATFEVDCPEETLPPETSEPTPSQPGQTSEPTPSQPPTDTPAPTPSHPTATPSKTPDHPVPSSPRRTLPPTDTRATVSVVARPDTVPATLFFIAVFAAAVALRRIAARRARRG